MAPFNPFSESEKQASQTSPQSVSDKSGSSKAPWTEAAETISIIACGGGVATAIIFQQLALAIVPPVFALSFNIINRSRRLQERRVHGLLSQRQSQELRQELQNIQGSLDSLPLAERIVEIEACVRRLSEATLELQGQQSGIVEDLEDDRDKIKEAFAILRQGVYNLSHHTNTSIDRLRTEMDTLRRDVEPTAKRVAQEITHQAIAPLQQQQQHFQGDLHQLQQQQSLLSPQVQQLTEAVTHLRTHTAQHWLSEIDRRLESVLPYRYRVVSEDASDCLFQALNQGKEHVLIVTPWLELDPGRSEAFLKAVNTLLSQNVFVSFGWGRRADVGRARDTHRPIALKDGGWRYQPERDPHGYYRLLPQLLDLKKRHKRLTLKLLGTAERIVVCDRDWALIGGHHLLCHAATNTPEVGLHTNDPHVVLDLSQRFNLVPHLKRRSTPTPQRLMVGS
ncbi:hypothetical protein [Sodalinema gerasimenkoae]|uniref:hypothetical protein n=1 Tax=Sodalinema gerasimenkoae TaxID=2862348 RepID=UPI001357C34D|nr:hypothetical protein [Sodalinema gerasimenkoae]